MESGRSRVRRRLNCLNPKPDGKLMMANQAGQTDPGRSGNSLCSRPVFHFFVCPVEPRELYFSSQERLPCSVTAHPGES